MARITLRLPDDLHRRLQNFSRMENVSLNQVIVGELSRACTRGDLDLSDDDSPAERVKRLRIILGDLVEDIDSRAIPAPLARDATLAEREAFRNSLPLLDPPLSATIAEEREDRF